MTPRDASPKVLRTRATGSGARIFVHPTALVESAVVGDGTRVWAYAHVMDGAKIGVHCAIGDHSFVESGAVVGDYVTLKNGVMVWDGVTIGNGAFVGPGVLFTNDVRPRSRRWPPLGLSTDPTDWLARTEIGEGASLGAGVVVVAGISVGAFAMVGAGSVVTTSIPPHGLGYGCPFILRGFVCRCGARLRKPPGRRPCRHRA